MPGFCDLVYWPFFTGRAQVASRHGGRTLIYWIAIPRPDVSDMRTLRTAGAIILMIAYGYPVKEHNDPTVNIIEQSNRSFSECLQPGAFMVDTFPLRESRFLRQPTAGSTNCIFLSFI